MTAIFAGPEEAPWLFGRRTDLAVFGGSALASFALLGLGAALGWLDGDTPDGLWLLAVVAVDVAHVWTTIFRVHLDPRELRRRPLLHVAVPLVCYAALVGAHAFSPLVFWRVLAYVAVFHFIRQQAGWVALYRRRAGEHGTIDRAIDAAAIYAATAIPIVLWHASLPRSFHWLIEGDFVPGLARGVKPVLVPLAATAMLAYTARQAFLLRHGRANAPKSLVVATTFACWWLGIVVFDGDYAFTVTNVLIHGVPYFALTYRYARARAPTGEAPSLAWVLRGGVLAFLVTAITLAVLEEGLWDRLVWHERGWLFGSGRELDATWQIFVVPLLALPQAVHYVLDGFVWRTRDNPVLATELSAPR